MKITRRQLAARFVDMVGDQPLPELATAFMEVARAAGYGERDVPALMAAVERELHRRHGAVEVRLTTAHELPKAELQALAGAVADAAGADSHTFTHRVDPELLGGFEATADGTSIRDSIRFNLTNTGGRLG